MIRQVMLSAKFDPNPALRDLQMDRIKFPVYASTKIDGVRAHTFQGKAYSRKNKLIPNLHIQRMMSVLPSHLDGELTIGSANTHDLFHRTQSGVMSHDGCPDFNYWVFDMIDEVGNNSAMFRQQILREWYEAAGNAFPFVGLVNQKLIRSLDELMEFEETCVMDGWEGIMIRQPMSPYKQGRSTLNEGWLIKMKRFEDSEAEVVGIYEQETNNNEIFINEVGKSKRSSHKENKIANGHLGGFRVVDTTTGIEFDIGTMLGVTKEQRYIWWQNPKKLLGQIIRYKFTPVGVKDKPRQPIFTGFRNSIDM